MRTFRCVDCPPEAGEYPAGSTRGPLPERCPAHKARRAARAEQRRRSRLRVVADGETPPPPPAVDPPAPRLPAAMLGALRADLDCLATTHPAAETLQMAATRLAAAIDDPMTGVTDGRILAALIKELRATLHELTSHEEEGRDDLFGDDSAGPVVVPTAT